jgi:hypothetical protein
MARHLNARHEISIPLPIDQCQMLFTPAGEELWVEGWEPTYYHPTSGATQKGMIFSTGSGDELTFWSLVDFDRGPERHFARYARVTPALRSGFVEIHCHQQSPMSTLVRVSYEMTALSAAGEISLQAYEPEAFAAMIEQWRCCIEEKLSLLATSRIR